MSGSLNILAAKWKAQTANCGLLVGQSKATAIISYKVLSGSDGGNCFMQTAGNVFQVLANKSITNVFLRGGNALLKYAFTPVIGQTYKIAAVLDDVGASTIYVDGVARATALGIGVTAATAAGIFVGCDGTKLNFCINDAAVWNGFAAPQAFIAGSRDGHFTPGTATPPATSWWTLQGVAGANPALGDPGLQDQIGGNHLVTLPGVGGLNINAAYSDIDLAYHAPITVDKVHITRWSGAAGGLAKFTIGTNPANGTAQEAYVTGITGLPTLKKNGAPMAVSALSPIWDSVGHSWPHMFVHFTDPVTPSDVITWDTPDGWVKASQGTAADDSGTAENAMGAFESPSFGYPSFDPALNPPRLQLGWNMLNAAAGFRAVMVKNCMRGLATWSLVNATYDANGFPLTILAANNGTATGLFWTSSANNGVDGRSFPTPTGTWEVKLDEWAPATPLIVGIKASGATVSAPTIIPGIIDGAGHEIGKRIQFDVEYNANPTNFSMNLTITFQTPGHGAGPFTIDPHSIRIADPGSNTDAPYNNEINPVWASKLTAAPGVYVPILRDLNSESGNDGAGTVVFASDLYSNDSFSYTNPPLRTADDWIPNDPTYTGSREVPIREIRKYDVTRSPFVYSQDQHINSVPSNIPEYPWMWDLRALGKGYDWPYPATGTPRSQCVSEWVCALDDGTPVKHNLQSGQLIDPFPPLSMPVHMTNDAGQKAGMTYGHGPIHVTGPYTFLTTGGSFLPKSIEMGYVDTSLGPYIQAGVKLLLKAATAFGPRPEDFGGLARGLPGCGFVFTVNHCMCDSGMLAYAQRLFDSMPPDTVVFPQYSNEILIFGNLQGFWLEQFCQLENLSKAQAMMRRANEMQNIFASVFGEARVKRMIQYFLPSQNSLLDALQYAQAHSMPLDYCECGVYIQIPNAPSVQEAAAACALNQQITIGGVPTFVSIAHPSNGGHGVGFNLGLFGDIWRHHERYNNLFCGQKGVFQTTQNTMVSSGYGSGATSGYIHALPKILGYECAISTIIPKGVSKQAKVVRAGLTHDFMYHPAYYDVATAFVQMMQQPGVDPTVGLAYACLEALNGLRQPSPDQFVCDDGADNFFSSEWGSLFWQGQSPGTRRFAGQQYWASDLGGDGKAHDDTNASPLMRAGLDWILEAAGFTPPPMASFEVLPTSVKMNQLTPVTLHITGTNTAFTADSAILVVNSVAGTTSVAAVAWNAISDTEATLDITTGPGGGIWQLIIDGVGSQSLMVIQESTRAWLGRMGRTVKS